MARFGHEKANRQDKAVRSPRETSDALTPVPKPQRYQTVLTCTGFTGLWSIAAFKPDMFKEAAKIQKRAFQTDRTVFSHVISFKDQCEILRRRLLKSELEQTQEVDPEHHRLWTVWTLHFPWEPVLVPQEGRIPRNLIWKLSEWHNRTIIGEESGVDIRSHLICETLE
jgi:hypothetical protein